MGWDGPGAEPGTGGIHRARTLTVVLGALLPCPKPPFAAGVPQSISCVAGVSVFVKIAEGESETIRKPRNGDAELRVIVVVEAALIGPSACHVAETC